MGKSVGRSGDSEEIELRGSLEEWTNGGQN